MSRGEKQFYPILSLPVLLPRGVLKQQAQWLLFFENSGSTGPSEPEKQFVVMVWAALSPLPPVE